MRARHRGRVGGEVAEIGFDEGLVDHLLDVGAGSKSLVTTGNQHAADVLIGVEALDCLTQLGLERLIERVERRRPVEPDDADPAFGLDNDVLVAHGGFPFSDARAQA